MDNIILILVTIISLAAGAVIGIFVRDKSLQKNLKKASQIIEDANEKALKLSKEIMDEAKSDVKTLKRETDEQIRERKSAIKEEEYALKQRTDQMDRRFEKLDKKEANIDSKEERIDKIREDLRQKNSLIEKSISEQEEKLLSISGYSREEAKKQVFESVKKQMSKELTEYIVEQEETAKDTANKKAKEYITAAIQKYSGEVTSDRTVSVVNLPSDDMKGRIIGREGRNIRAIEALTGVDLIIDDTPEAVVLSCFDPVRREVARFALDTLVNDGRIHPAKIESAVDKGYEFVEELMLEKANEAVFQTGVGKLPKELLRLLGRLHFRTSYGQNVLKHSIEVAMFAGAMAAEIGENEVLARRAGLLHDIGKAVDHEMEGSHVDIGVKLAEKYNEPEEVINAIASHHGDVPATSFISELVAAGDTLSAGRPGARSEAVQNYFERLKKLESMSADIDGVEEVFAISAGRELRVMVKPDKVDDLGVYTIARELKEKIESNLTYPGTIKVTVIREQRAIDVAK